MGLVLVMGHTIRFLELTGEGVSWLWGFALGQRINDCAWMSRLISSEKSTSLDYNSLEVMDRRMMLIVASIKPLVLNLHDTRNCK